MAGPSMSMFPHHRTCTWIDVSNSLRARTCDDGETLMWHDTDTGETWLATETPPKKWRRYFKKPHLSGFGDASASGVCPPHPSIRPQPLAKIARLQSALAALAHRVGDHLLNVTADGLVGPHTVKATNRAMYMYAKGGAPSEFTTSQLTHAQVVAFSPQLATYIERSPIAASTRTAPAESPSLPAPPQISPSAQVPVQYLPPSGGAMNPQYYQQPGYYPPQPAYYSNRAPGGLPADRASVDVKAFIPAQYEHVRVDPTTVMAAIIVGVGIYIVMSKKKKEG